MNANIILLPVLIPLFTAIAGLIFRSIRIQQPIGVIGGIATLWSSWQLFCDVRNVGYRVLHVGGWTPPYGITLVADHLSAIMVVIASLMACLVALYSIRDVDAMRKKLFYFPLYNFLSMAINGAFLTGDIFNLYVWFEVMLISSFVLLALGGAKPQIEGAFKYVSINLISSAMFLSGIGLLYAKVGTLNMADIAVKLNFQSHSFLINSTAILFLSAFGIKAALFPFFFWLPASYHTPPAAISAIFAGLLTKVGVYALIRSSTLFFRESFYYTQNLLLVIAGLTMVTGVLGAAAQYRVRKILSFHIISQIGYMIMGLALFTPLALAGMVFYLIHHIIVKTNLFLLSGIIEKIHGSDDLSRLGGLYRSSPGLAGLFCISAFSLGGIPPLSGFWAKFALIKAGLEIDAFWISLIALLVGLMTLFSMTKIWGEAFWKACPETAESKDIAPVTNLALMYIPATVMAVMTLYLGFFGQTVFDVAQATSAQLLDPRGYIEAVLGGGGR